MPTGIDVGSQTVRVATPAGTTEYRNAIQRVDDADDAPGSADDVVVERDGGAYVVGPVEVEQVGETAGPLFPRSGGNDRGDPAVRHEVLEAFLSAVRDESAGGSLRVVSWQAGAKDPLNAVGADLAGQAAALDPGIAVSYDALASPVTGIGIAIDEAMAVATFAVAGLPVATARVAVDDAWFDIAGGGDGGNGGDRTAGPGAAWRTRQYEGLIADLADELARTVPTMAEAVPVVVGGAAAPEDGLDVVRAALASPLPFEIAEITVSDGPASAVARGALVAAEADGGPPAEPPLPPFGVDVPFVGVLADVSATTAALGEGGRGPDSLARWTGSGAAAPGTTAADRATHAPSAGEDAARPSGNGEEPVEVLVRRVSRTRADVDTLERRGAMTARGLSDVVSQLDAGGAAGADVEALRADLDAIEARLPGEETLDSLEDGLDAELEALQESVDAIQSDLERLDQEAASTERVADLEASLDALESSLGAVEDDTDRLRAVLAGLETDSDIEAPDLAPDEVEGLQAEALQDEIAALETRLEDRVEDLWDELDGVDDRLTELSAAAEDIPDLESTVTTVRNTVDDLESQTSDLAESVEALQADVDSMTDDSASAAELDALAQDVEHLRSALTSVRETFEGIDRVDPATVAGIEDDLDALRQTLITRAERLEDVEQTAATLSERIETIYENSAKSEALASVETEIARIRQTAADAMERTNDMTETVSELGTSVDDHAEQLGMLSTNVDNLAANSVTRPEMDAAIEDVDDRLRTLESELRSEVDDLSDLIEEARHSEGPGPALEGNLQLVVTLQAVALVAVGLLGAFLAFDAGFVLVAGGFLVFAIMPGVLSWLVS
ncbi:MAG: hypothetical protein V5A43_01195 [Haloarculaceae archaeon]